MSGWQRLRQSPGFVAIVWLTILTGVEYVISAASIRPVFAWLVVIAVAKAVVIVLSFMHLRNLFAEDTR